MKLSKQRKLIVLITGGAIVIALIAAAIIEWTVPNYLQKNEVYYTYKSKGSIGYKVYLRPNIMYNTKYLEEDRYYVFKYVDRVDMEFNYNYAGSAAADLKTEYVVTASLQGLHGADSDVLWSKEYALVPGKTEQAEKSSYNITQKASVDLHEFYNLKETLFADSEVNTPVILNVVFNIHTLAATSDGILEDSLNPSLTIPIGENVFRIDGQRYITGGKRIEKTLRELVPTDNLKIILLLVVSIVLIGMLVFVVRMEETEPMDPFTGPFPPYSKNTGKGWPVWSMPYHNSATDVINVTIEDMVVSRRSRAARIHYKVDDRSERKIEFYVFDNNRIYYMVIFGEIKNPTKDEYIIEE